MSRFGLEISEHPRVLAMVMCEKIIIEEGTQRRTLVGLFDSIEVAQCPTNLMGFNIHMELARGVTEQIEIYVGLFAPDGTAVIQSAVQIGQWADRGLAQMEFRIPPFGLPVAGEYDLRAFVADAVLAQRMLVVRTTQPPSEEAADSPKS